MYLRMFYVEDIDNNYFATYSFSLKFTCYFVLVCEL